MVQVDFEQKQTIEGNKSTISILNVTTSRRVRNSPISNNSIPFRVERVLSRSKNSETFESNSELKDVLENGASIFGSTGKKETDNRKKIQQEQDFFLCDDFDKKRNKKKRKRNQQENIVVQR